MSTAFVTGASGFVGTHLVRQLAAAGWQTHILSRSHSNLQDLAGLDIQVHQGDVTDLASLLRAVPEQADAVFHVAASTNVWRPHNAAQTQINIQGTENMLQAARQRGVRRFIHTSTFAVWGFQEQTFNEQTPVRLDADWINYVRSKRAAQNAVRRAIDEHGLDAVILHPAHILGPHDRHNWSRMIRMVWQGSLPGVPPGGGVFADVRQVAAAHLSAYQHGRRGEHYLLGGQAASYLQLVQIIGSILGRRVPQRTTPAVLLRLVARIQDYLGRWRGKAPDLTPEGAAMITHHLHCDSSKAQRELGYQLTPLEDLVRDTCDWMRHEGLLASDEAA